VSDAVSSDEEEKENSLLVKIRVSYKMGNPYY
jgi:hypothetical protein